jgi:hypothetical protein
MRQGNQGSCGNISRSCLPSECRTWIDRCSQLSTPAVRFGRTSIVAAQRRCMSCPCVRRRQKAKSHVTTARDFCTPAVLARQLDESPPHEASQGRKGWHRLQTRSDFDRRREQWRSLSARERFGVQDMVGTSQDPSGCPLNDKRGLASRRSVDQCDLLGTGNSAGISHQFLWAPVLGWVSWTF